MKHLHTKLVTLLLTPLVLSFAFGLDIYIPVVHEMGKVFHASPFLIQMSLSLFLLTIAVGELFMGPLSDQFGRKSIALISVLIFIAGSMISAMAWTIYMLILGRVVCALGACGLLVVSFAMVRDLYGRKERGQVYSWLNSAIGISPTFAPIIGSYLALWFGWRSVFWFLVLLGLLVLFTVAFYIGETLPVSKRKRVGRDILRRYYRVITTKSFVKYALFASFGVSICFSFFSISPFILIGLLHLSKIAFSYSFAIFGLALLLGGMLSSHLIARKGLDTTIAIGIALMFIGSLAMIGVNLLFGLYLLPFLFTMVIACTGGVLLIGAGAAGALESFADIAGTAAAALQSMEFLMASALGTILMSFSVQSSIHFGVLIVGIAVASVLVCRIRLTES